MGISKSPKENNILSRVGNEAQNDYKFYLDRKAVFTKTGQQLETTCHDLYCWPNSLLSSVMKSHYNMLPLDVTNATESYFGRLIRSHLISRSHSPGTAGSMRRSR